MKLLGFFISTISGFIITPCIILLHASRIPNRVHVARLVDMEVRHGAAFCKITA
jgi:hypothetical protein